VRRVWPHIHSHVVAVKRVAIRARQFSLLPVSALRVAVSIVVGVRADEKMLGIDAGRGIAFVKNAEPVNLGATHE
jgi:hypothetical protein